MTYCRSLYATLFFLFLPITGFTATVAVIDTGINLETRLDIPLNKLVSGRCYSFEDVFTTTPIPGQQGVNIDYDYRFASLCPNGQGVQTVGQNLARHPRLVIGRENEFLKDEYFKVGEDVRHGNQVADAVYAFNRNVFVKPIQAYAYNSLRTFSVNGVQINCGPNIFPSQQCYGTTSINIKDALRRLADVESGSISAVSISTVLNGGSLCGDRIGQSEINRLHARGIAVVAALENTSYGSSEISWPNCLENVVNVARVGGQAGIGANGISFYADGGIHNGAAGGNSFAAPRVAAAYALLHDAEPTSSVEQKTEALNEASSLMNTYSGVTRRYIRSDQMSSAITELRAIDSFPVPVTSTNGYIDSSTHSGVPEGIRPTRGEVHSLDIFLEGDSPFLIGASPKLTDEVSLSGNRDMVLSFEARYSAGSPGVLSRFEIDVNGVHRFSTPHNLNWPFHSFSYVISRNWLNPGSNKISFRVKEWFNTTWYLRNINIGATPPIQLRLNQQINTGYGNQFGTNKNPTGLRVQFPRYAHNLQFSIKGFDIDVADEIAVFLNNKHLGFLQRSPGSSQYNEGDGFILNKNNLSANNTLELVQRLPDGSFGGGNDEKWGVIQMRLSEHKPVVPNGALLLLLGD